MGGVRTKRVLAIDRYIANRTPEQRRKDFFRLLPERIRFNLGRLVSPSHYESGDYYRHGCGPDDGTLQVYREFLERHSKNRAYWDSLEGKDSKYAPEQSSKGANPLMLFFGLGFLICSTLFSLSAVTGFSILNEMSEKFSLAPIILFLLGIMFLYFSLK